MRTKTSDQAERVGTTELRGNLAKYLKKAKAGRPIIVQERGVDTYMLVSYRADAPASVFGGLRDRTQYDSSVIANANESWTPGKMP